MTTSITTNDSFTLVTTSMPVMNHEKEMKEHAALLDIVTNNTNVNFIKAFTILNTASDELIHTAYCGVNATPAVNDGL